MSTLEELMNPQSYGYGICSWSRKKEMKDNVNTCNSFMDRQYLSCFLWWYAIHHVVPHSRGYMDL